MERVELKEIAQNWIDGLIKDKEFIAAVDAYTSALIAAKPYVGRSVEIEKQQPTLSADEIKNTAEILWKKPMKLEAVKLVMKLGYSLKDAKAYCDLHFG